MKVNMMEVEQLVENINEVDFDVADAYNKLCTIGMDTGLIENPEFMESIQILMNCIYALRNLNFENGIEYCKMKSMIEAIKNKSSIGQYLVEEVMKEEA